MVLKNQAFRSIVIAATMLSPVMITGCAVHAGVGYRVYDPYYEDYHVWEGPEIGYYNQWSVETHRPHREFRTIPREEQREYWHWRHDHHPDRH